MQRVRVAGCRYTHDRKAAVQIEAAVGAESAGTDAKTRTRWKFLKTALADMDSSVSSNSTRSKRPFAPLVVNRHGRSLTGLLMICLGLAMTAAISIASPLGVTGVRLWVVALPFVGAALIRFGPVYGLAKRAG